jgi:hypothetical protein
MAVLSGGFSWFSWVPPGKYRHSTSIGHDRLLPNHFQVIIHLSSIRSTLYNVATEIFIK